MNNSVFFSHKGNVTNLIVLFFFFGWIIQLLLVTNNVENRFKLLDVVRLSVSTKINIFESNAVVYYID